MISRVIALALGASMLLLNVERADRECAHGDRTRMHAADMQAMPGHHSGHNAATRGANRRSADGSDGCRTPVQADCCQLLTTCTVVLGMTSEVETTPAAPARERVANASLAVPASHATSPETPPPRV